MAGFLGTLFMGGVGLRLLLPPMSGFRKLATQLKSGMRLAAQGGQAISDEYANRRKNALKRDVERSNELIKALTKKGNKEQLAELNALAIKIDQVHGRNTDRLQKRLARVDKEGRLGFKGRPITKGAQADLDNALAKDPRIRGLGAAFQFLAKHATEGVGAILSLGRAIATTLVRAIQQSTMIIITFAFQIGMLARNFMTFEKELINANSIFQTTRENLYAMSDELIKFGLQFGINYEDASKVLYQFASAGLSAEESMVALKDTLTLTMAVQGDFNTLGKLMVQVIKGFGMEMDQTGIIADKFAYTINKSLIEWKDLSAAVKFAMPFFVAAGQSIDQLLGSLAILTDRALEAGIAGRGLRQAIAQFVEHADDNNAAFRKLGVEILDTEGNMRQLTDIALQFEAAMGDDISQMDIMMTLMKDLNIRGATAFVHLAQNATEFKAAVDDLVNSQGAANEMAEYQQASLTNQIQLLKNAIYSVFYLSDATYAGTGAINGFDYALKKLVETLKNKFTVELADGTFMLTEFGYGLRDVVIKAVYALGDVIINIVDIIQNLTAAGSGLYDTMSVLFGAIKLISDVLANMDPATLKLIMQIWLLNNLFGLGGGLVVGFGLALAKLGDWMNSIVPGAERLAYALAIIVGALAGGVLGAISGFVTGAATGAVVGGTAGYYGGGSTGLIAGGTAGAISTAPMGGWGGLVGAVGGYLAGALGGTVVGALGGALTGGMIGGAAGFGVGAAGGAYGGHKLYQGASAMQSGLYNQSAEGTSIPALSSYSAELNMLSVNNLYAANDNLAYRAEDSAAITGWA